MTRFSILKGQDDQQDVPLTQYSEPLSFSNRIPASGATEQSRSLMGAEKQSPKDHQITFVSPHDGGSPQPINKRQHSSNSKSSRRASSLFGGSVSNFRIPRFAAPWQHEVDGSPLKGHRTVRRFDPNAQWRRIFVNGLSQWFVTLFITLIMWALLFGFSRKAKLGQKTKYSFNAAITIASLALGLSLVAALQNYAKILSWRFLAGKYRNLQDFELIMQCDSQTKVVKLLWAGRTPGRWLPNGTQILCLLSLGIVIGLQIVIGMLGLTYSVNTAENEYEHHYGNASIVDLLSFHQDSNYNTSTADAQQAAVNYFGIAGNNVDIYYDTPAGQSPEAGNAIYTSDNSTWYYSFVDQNPDQTLFLLTSRYIGSTATCVQLDIVAGGYYNSSKLEYKNEHGETMTIVPHEITSITTTWMANASSDCGPRCTQLLVLNTGNQNNSDTSDNYTPSLFACNNTISTVQGTADYPKNYTYELKDEQARYLAGGVGWTGFWFADDPLQYKDYPPGSYFSWDGYPFYTDPSNVAQLVMQFSAQALAGMDSIGPRVFTLGYSPRPASQLSVEWNYAIPILAIIPTVQFALLCIVCIWANGVVIKDGSHLASARLLRPVVENLKNHGCALTGDEIARELGNFKIIYGVRAPGPGSLATGTTAYDPLQDAGDGVDYHLGVIREDEGYGDTPEEGWSPGRRFPVGRYDGMAAEEEELLLRSSGSSETLCASESDFLLKEDAYDEEAAVLR